MATDQDRAELRATVRRFLTGGDADWTRMARELGLQGLGLPESVGGSGCGPQELAVVHEELGRVLDASPFFATVALAATALLASGDEEYLPGIASGDTIAALALPEIGADPASVVAVQDPDGWVLDGECAHVLAGDAATLVLVPAVTRAGLSLFALTGEGLARTPLTVLDGTRPQGRLTLTEAPARLIGTDGEAGPVLARTQEHASVALAAEQVGAAQACLDLAVTYAKERVQFGRVIGSFQAVKHLLADLAIEVDLARSAAEEATLADADNDARLPMLASIAQACCSETLVHVAEENIQIHGGIGVTWEHPAHLYFRRATWAESFLGSPADHRRLIADLLERQASNNT